MTEWKKGIPTRVGWYWKRNTLDKYDKPEVVHVRDYAGKLAIGNSTLEGWESMAKCEWAGPIPLPSETTANTREK